MKHRTIKELHDKYIGHRKFAKVCDTLINNGYEITDIREYNEQFKFKIDGYEQIYNKEWKGTSEEFVYYLLNILEMRKMLGSLLK